LRDAVELEWAGVPSVAIVHEEMTGSAKAIARISGHPDYAFITVGYPHIPLAMWDDEEIRTVAKTIAPQIRELLTRQPG
jgi:hypothetical protein